MTIAEQNRCDHCGQDCDKTALVMVCKQTMSSPAEYEQWGECCVRDEDDPHERAASRARSNDFAATDFKDWT